MKNILLICCLFLSFCIVYGQENQDMRLSDAGTISRALQTPYIPKTHIIKTNPFAAITGQMLIASEVRVAYEKAYNKNTSSMIGLSYNTASPLAATLSSNNVYNTASPSSATLYLGTLKLRVNGVRIQAAQKWFINPNKGIEPAGTYFGIHASYNYANVAYDDYESYYDTSYYFYDFIEEPNNQIFRYLNVNLIFGYQYISRGGFVFDTFIGMGYKNNQIQTNTTRYEYNHNTSSYDVTTGYSYIEQNYFPIKLSWQTNIGFAF